LSSKAHQQIMRQDEDQRLPLHHACKNNSADVVKMLLAYLPEDQVLHQDFRGRIPLHYAIENAEAVEMVKILLKYIPDQQVLAAKQKRVKQM